MGLNIKNEIIQQHYLNRCNPDKTNFVIDIKKSLNNNKLMNIKQILNLLDTFKVFTKYYRIYRKNFL